MSRLLAAVGRVGCAECPLGLSCGTLVAAGLAASVFLGQASAVALSINERSPPCPLRFLLQEKGQEQLHLRQSQQKTFTVQSKTANYMDLLQ